MGKVQIYTDGAARGNPDGPGGYGAVLQYVDRQGVLHEKELSAGYVRTTNNRMELMAAIQGLRALKEPCAVRLFSDSTYLVNAFEKNWLQNWQKRNWLTAAKKPVENQDLWQELLILSATHAVEWVKVRGHAANPGNNRCDELARGEIKQHAGVEKR